MALWVHHQDLDEGHLSTKTLSPWTVSEFTGRTVESRWPGLCRSPRTEVLHSTQTEIPFSCPCLGGIPGKPFPYAAPQLIPVQCRSFCVCRAGLSATLILHMQPQRGCVGPLQCTTLKFKQKPHLNLDISYSLITLQPAALHHQPADWIRIRFVQFNCWPLLITDRFVATNKAWFLLAEHCLLLQQILNQRWQRIPRARRC